jgi:hypothetical protein
MNECNSVEETRNVYISIGKSKRERGHCRDIGVEGIIYDRI